MRGPGSTGVHGPWGKGAALASADIPQEGDIHLKLVGLVFQR